MQLLARKVKSIVIRNGQQLLHSLGIVMQLLRCHLPGLQVELGPLHHVRLVRLDELVGEQAGQAMRVEDGLFVEVAGPLRS